MVEGPSSKRMTPGEIATAIRSVAKQYGSSPRGEFLRALAGTIETGLTSTGFAEGRYGIVRSANGVKVQCENAAQIGWVEVICRTVKINFITPHGRALERELHIT